MDREGPEKGLELCPLICHIAVTNYTEIFKDKKWDRAT